MIKIHLQELKEYLRESCYSCYFLLGNDDFLLKEGKNIIVKWACKQNYTKILNIEIGINDNWKILFDICKTRNLFFERQILLLTLPKNCILYLKNKLIKLVKLINKDLILILIYNTQNNFLIKKDNFFINFNQKMILIDCFLFKEDLSYWINIYVKKIGLNLNEDVFKFLHKHYRDCSLITLIKFLKLISLIYPNQNINISKIKLISNNNTKFDYNKYIEYTLKGETKKAILAIKYLRSEFIDPSVLLRNIKYEILNLLIIQNKKDIKINRSKIFFYNYKTCYNKMNLLIQASKRLNFFNIKNAVKLSIKIDSFLRNNYIPLVWSNLELLTLLLCGKINSMVDFDE